MSSLSSASDQNQFRLHFAADLGFAVAHDHVNLTAHAELGQINAGLDGEAGVGDDLAVVLGLEIVHVSAGGVDLDSDGVPGAVRKILAVAFSGDVVARGL